MKNAAIPSTDRHNGVLPNDSTQVKPPAMNQKPGSGTISPSNTTPHGNGDLLVSEVDRDIIELENLISELNSANNANHDDHIDDQESLLPASSNRPKFTIAPISNHHNDNHHSSSETMHDHGHDERPSQEQSQQSRVAHVSTLVIPAIQEPTAEEDTDTLAWTTPAIATSGNQPTMNSGSNNKQSGENVNMTADRDHSDTIYQIDNGPVPMSTAAVTTPRALAIPASPSTTGTAYSRSGLPRGGLRTVQSAHRLHNVHESLAPNASAKMHRTSSYVFGDDAVNNRIFTDTTSIRSLASIGMGSTDGKKMVIRRVPTSPTELFKIVNPQTPVPNGGDDDDDSYGGMSDDQDATNLKPRRQHWANKMQFVLACIGYSVGLGNVWRFPYLCYKSGGGVFLIPYLIILIICGIPMLFMELAVGQYTGRGPIGALGQICPLFKGAGLGGVIVSFIMSTYYSVIIAYAIYYFFTSFKPVMPWTDCNNRWNTPDCWVPHRLDANITPSNLSRTPSEEFFENKVLKISAGIEYAGSMRWELVACLICAWLLVYFAIWKSIKSSAKVRYFTATFPFVLIIVLMGRALTLDGAEEGLRFFFRPKWELLKNANVWINAAAQNFNSLGIAFGSMISFASYNKYNNNILHDTLAVSAVNAVTSILVGVFAFATLGNLAFEQNTTIEDAISDGPGLIFVVYPQAMAKMPAGQLWAVMFFFMLLCLGLNSQFAIVEVVVTAIQDGFPHWIKRKLIYHELLVLIICIISFFFGLPNLVQGGIYFFQLVDHYAASISIMFLAFFQMIAIAWFYGVNRLSKNVKQMTGKAPSLYFTSCWLICAPFLLISLWIFSLINYQQPTYHNGKYVYPDWAYGIGWGIAGLSLICIPAYAIVSVLRAGGNNWFDKIKGAMTPNIYECRICGEHHCEHDFPDEQYVLPQEMTPIIQPKLILKTPPPGHYTRIQPPLMRHQNSTVEEVNEETDSPKS